MTLSSLFLDLETSSGKSSLHLQRILETHHKWLCSVLSVSHFRLAQKKSSQPSSTFFKGEEFMRSINETAEKKAKKYKKAASYPAIKH
jgi:hypothetical protein